MREEAGVGYLLHTVNGENVLFSPCKIFVSFVVRFYHNEHQEQFQSVSSRELILPSYILTIASTKRLNAIGE